jgi:Ca2+-binding EF-hand superfamily protein
MKQSFKVLFTGTVLLLSSAVAQDSYAYSDFDTNGDGAIDATEFSNTYGSDLYNTFDADSNGSVNQNEFGGGVYTLFDANDDNVLSEGEYDAGVNALYGGDYDALSNRDYDGTYAGLDADDNGEVSEEEFINAYDPSSLYGTFDADGDGQLGETEFNEGVFGAADDNGDGTLTEDEYNAAPLLFGSTGGDVAGGGVSRSRDTTFNAENYRTFGDVGIGAYEPLEEGVAGGALSLAYTSPNEQNVDFNVTGPNGYREDFEVGYIGLEMGGDARVVSGLEPGVYSVAATDDSLQLIETKVEVREGELVSLDFNMQLIEDFEYNLADYEPYGAYEVGAYEPIGIDTYGNLIVTVEMADGNDAVAPNINVTGPDDFRRELEGDRALQALVEGPYSVAATAPGYRMTEGKVDVRHAEAAQVTLTLEPLAQNQ